jgi:hypothetical protein
MSTDTTTLTISQDMATILADALVMARRVVADDYARMAARADAFGMAGDSFMEDVERGRAERAQRHHDVLGEIRDLMEDIAEPTTPVHHAVARWLED